MKCFVTWLNHIMQTHTEANTTSCLLVFVHNRLRSPSRPIYAPCLILPLRCLMSWMPSTTSLTMTLSWEWVSKHTTINTSIHKYLCPTNCTGHHFWSISAGMFGRKCIREKADHAGSSSQRVCRFELHCVGILWGAWQEPMFNYNTAWCTQCHPVCTLWASICKKCMFIWSHFQLFGQVLLNSPTV